MSGFFDDVEPDLEVEPERHRSPEWAGPPHGTMPAVVALDLDLGRSEMAAVQLTHAEVYPTGLMLGLLVLVGDEVAGPEPLLFGPHHRRGGAAAREDAAARLRFGLRYANGAKATNLRPGFGPPDPSQAPIVLLPQGGGGGGGRWSQELWLWPLPPPGPVTFVCEWPEAKIALNQATVDAATFQEAATRALVLFPDERPEMRPPGEGGGWTRYAPS